MMTYFSQLFQSFNSWQIFIFVMSFMTIGLVLHNRFRNVMSGLLISFACIACSAFFITSPELWLLFLIGGISYLILDIVAVARHEWRYNTKSGYVIWAGPGWGFLTIIIYQLLLHFDVFFLFVLLALTSVLILFRIKDELKEMNLELGMLIFTLLCLAVMPKVFLISFGLGTVIEYLAVNLFKSWKYRRLTFVQIGLGYSALVVATFMLFYTLQGNFSVKYLLIIAGLLVFQIRYYRHSR